MPGSASDTLKRRPSRAPQKCNCKKSVDLMQLHYTRGRPGLQFGERYTVPVILYGRKDHFLRLNTVWQIDTGAKAPHFITATPERKK